MQKRRPRERRRSRGPYRRRFYEDSTNKQARGAKVTRLVSDGVPDYTVRSTNDVAPRGMKGSHRVIRSLYFTSEPDGTLGLAAAMEHAVLEVIAVPDDYTDAMAQQIAESVHKAGILETRARTGARGRTHPHHLGGAR